LLAGVYPAWLITRANPIEALRDSARKGKKGARVRSVMIGAQFAISAFMLAVVAIVFMQNEKVKESSYIFPRSEIYTMDRLSVDGISDRLDTLKHELEALPNVETVAYSSQVPFEQNNSQRGVSLQPGDEAGQINLQYMDMSPDFLDAYDIPVLAGRGFDRNIALEALQIASASDAINKRFYLLNDDGPNTEFVIVGVLPTQNIIGLFNQEKPWMFCIGPSRCG
jgi:putative ABC transport system permease protein